MLDRPFFRDPKVAEFARHMDGLRGPDGCVRFTDLNLMNIYKLAPFIALLDIETPPRRYRVRYIGTQIVESYGQDCTGMYCDELDLGPNKQALAETYDRLIESRRPQWTYSVIVVGADREYAGSEDKRYAYERISYPLLDKNGEIGHVASLSAIHLVRDGTEHFLHRELD